VHATEGDALRSEDVSFDVSFLSAARSRAADAAFHGLHRRQFLNAHRPTPYLQTASTNTEAGLDRAMHYDGRAL